MFQGGKSFGFMNGANYGTDPGARYSPQTTSYDYDAALDEAGRPTKKYYLLRDVIQKRTGITPPPLPKPIVIAAAPKFSLVDSASLWDNLPAPIKSEKPRSMENFGQSYGYILYRKHVAEPLEGTLTLDDLRDYASIYLDGKLVGTLDRRLNQKSLPIKLPSGGAILDI